MTEASRAHANGTSTITDQPISTTWEKTLTAASPPAGRPPPVRRVGVGAGVSLRPVGVVTAMAAPQYSIRSRRVARSMTAAMISVRKNRTTPIADA